MQEFRHLFYDTKSLVDAAMFIPHGHTVRVEVNGDNRYKFDGICLNFTSTSCVVVIAQKTSKGIAYSFIHADELITAEDIRREFLSKQDGGKMIFICNQLTKNDKLQMNIKREFSKEGFLYFPLCQDSYLYVPFENINHFISKVTTNKKNSQTKKLLGSVVKGNNRRKKIPLNSVAEFDTLPPKEEIRLSAHPQGLKLFAHEYLTKAFPTKKELTRKPKKLVLYDEHYWLPLTDEALSMPNEALPQWH